MRYKKMSSILFSLLLLMSLASCGGPVDVTSNSATGSITLTWDAPDKYTDNSPLTPAGYYIYYGPSSSNYTHVVYAGNVTLYTIDKLLLGTYYFTVTVYDASGNESVYALPEVVMEIK